MTGCSVSRLLNSSHSPSFWRCILCEFFYFLHAFLQSHLLQLLLLLVLIGVFSVDCVFAGYQRLFGQDSSGSRSVGVFIICTMLPLTVFWIAVFYVLIGCFKFWQYVRFLKRGTDFLSSYNVQLIGERMP